MTDKRDDVFGEPEVPRPNFAERFRPNRPGNVDPDDGIDDAGYRPYGLLPAVVGEVCEVRRWIDGTDTAEGVDFQYRFLMQVGFTGEEILRLFLPDCIVVIEGRRLLELRKKLALRTVTYIQQHNLRIWPLPPQDAPCIERIEIVRPEAFKSRA